MKKYFTLCVLTENGFWSPEFGDYQRSVVNEERQCYRDSGTKASHLKIIVSADTGEAVEDRVSVASLATA